MNEIEITVCGSVCSDINRRTLAENREVTAFRIVSSPRYLKDGVWTNGANSYFAVSCFGALGRNVFASVHRGDPVVVRGRVRLRNWEKDGVTYTSADIDAIAVGHDLTLGTATFQRPQRQGEASAPLGADPWAAVDASVAQTAREAGLSPERAAQDLAAQAA